MIKNIVAWDLGATKCAAAVVEYDEHKKQLTCKKQGAIKIRTCQSLAELTAKLEEMLETKMADATGICIGAAGQYDGEQLHLQEGYPYPMQFAAISDQQDWPNFAVVHDYSPIVCATFTSYIESPDNVRLLNKATMNPHGRRVALGIGTGVGMKDGILLPSGDFWLGTNEIGHIGVTHPPLANAGQRERHREFIRHLRRENIIQENESITYEKILAGQGIVRIHSFYDRNAMNMSAEEVGDLVRNGKANDTLALFSWYLGLLIGTVQLAFMPDGGIWLTGGVVLSHLEVFDNPEFYYGIEASPAYGKQRQSFPLGILCGNEHAFMGGAYYVTKRLLK